MNPLAAKPVRSNGTIQSLWIGDTLGVMEQLSLRSFLACGHEVHLYHYGPLSGVPDGVVLRDGAEILPPQMVFTYRTGFGQGSFSAFSNVFRYKLLLDRGGWWVDADVVCLRPFDFPQESLFGTERTGASGDDVVVSTSVLKQSPGSPLMAWAWAQCETMDPFTLQWGDIGPRLLQRGIDAMGWREHLLPERTFSPVPHWECQSFVDGRGLTPFGPETSGVHLWHQMWIHTGLDPDGTFPASSYYEGLKERFGLGSRPS